MTPLRIQEWQNSRLVDEYWIDEETGKRIEPPTDQE